MDSWVHEERVPPPPNPGTATSSWTLPILRYPPEQAFAALVTRMNREIHNIHFIKKRLRDLFLEKTWTKLFLSSSNLFILTHPSHLMNQASHLQATPPTSFGLLRRRLHRRAFSFTSRTKLPYQRSKI
ncbi:hypothetical protein E3N88_26100 [Mikania micrantha]|uniref:Uncharacterized protein n=1 Tax=Mikania micrantha TaxID=192012 RepID=A0A5N6N9D0_9ASTR|nr:hypothetical protein E3N88_26100 [Mikania micrantha]